MKYSIVNFSKLETYALRIDAEYYKPQYLKDDEFVSHYQQRKLGDCTFITDGQHGYHEVDENSNINLLTAKNAKTWIANNINADKIAQWVDDNNKRSSLKSGDIILSTRGTVGCCAIVKNEVLPANIDQDIARIFIKNKEILPEYLLIFFNSKFGQDWIIRNSSGMVQQGISLDKLRLANIPFLKIEFQTRIKQVIDSAYNIILKSKKLYLDSENMILNELGLKNWKPKHKKYSIKNYSEAAQAERIDAEYFQPKYEEIISAIKKYKNGYSDFREIIKLKNKNFLPKGNIEYKYIELSNINSNGEINGYTKAFGKDLPTRARRIAKNGDLIVSSIEGSLSSIALITQEYNNVLCSTGFYIINSDIINSETLLILLKSAPYQLLLKKGCSGTILTAINQEEIIKIPIPKIDIKIQNEIQKNISEMYNIRRQSTQLLEIAKCSVEIAIEETESKALKWLDSEMKKV
ncbi:MAG TPA: restriction endonuclease subunit S [bacterium]|nr:restriction endonuclease subunit S [bacterium]HPN29802.1 restriction endonuclease subunit S [bacterium]